MMLSLQETIDLFFFHCTYEKNLSPKSIKAYRLDLKQFVAFTKRQYSNISVDSIDKKLLREYMRVLFQGNKPKTIKRKVATLKSFFTYLEFEDIISVNPFRKMEIKIKEEKRLPRTIALRKIVALFNYLYEKRSRLSANVSLSYGIVVRDIAILELLFVSGLRVSELCNLSKDKIDLSSGSLRIIGKGNKERLIPICNAETLSALRSYYDLFALEISRSGYFFVNRLHRRLSEQSVRFMIRKHSEAIRLDQKITPHMFRHSIATLLLENGVDIRYIQTLLGHSSITTTQIYVQVNDDAQRNILLDKHPRNLFAGSAVPLNAG